MSASTGCWLTRPHREERNADADPLKLYDAAVARALLEEAGL